MQHIFESVIYSACFKFVERFPLENNKKIMHLQDRSIFYFKYFVYFIKVLHIHILE